MANRKPLCEQRNGTRAETSAKELSLLIAKDVGVQFPPDKIIEFFRLNFRLASMLAHEIHDGLPK